MLKIRLSRHGKKRQPSYRVVVTEAEFRRDGRYVERLGWYNPLTDPSSYLINEARALYWLSVGAQPTDPVRRLLKKQGTLDRLARLHKGETLEALVAEYQGVELTAPVAEPVVVAEPTIFEQVVEAVSGAVETVQEAVADVVADVREAVSGEPAAVVEEEVAEVAEVEATAEEVAAEVETTAVETDEKQPAA